jgi:hypothetical protein
LQIDDCAKAVLGQKTGDALTAYTVVAKAGYWPIAVERIL